VKLISRSAVGHKHAACSHRPRQTEVAKAQHVASKRGFCEICKVNFTDMKMVGSLIQLSFYISVKVLEALCFPVCHYVC